MPKKKVRSNSLDETGLRAIVDKIAIGDIVRIVRQNAFGEPDPPVSIIMHAKRPSDFVGEVMMDEDPNLAGQSQRKNPAMGGGMLQFNFDDGDIMEITIEKKSLYHDLHKDSMPKQEIAKLIVNLDKGDPLILEYIDRETKELFRVRGKLAAKSDDLSKFKILSETINDIQVLQESGKKEIELDIREDIIFDIQIML